MDSTVSQLMLWSFELDSGRGSCGKSVYTGVLSSPSEMALLLEKPGQVVLRDEIRKKLWPNDTVVEFDHSINAAMQRLRQALGDQPKPQYIETLARVATAGNFLCGRGRTTKAAERTGAEATRAQLPQAETDRKKVSHYRVLEMLGGGGMGVCSR